MVQTRGISIWTRISRSWLVGLLLSCAGLSCPESVASEPLFDDPIFELAPPRAWDYSRSNPFSDVVLQVVDLDGDGLLDLAGVGGNSASVAWGNDDGTFTSPWRAGGGYGFVVEDLNADGRPDLIMGSSGAFLSVLLGQADRSFLRVNGPSSKKRAFALAAGDFDGDGLRDIVNVTIGNSLAVHSGNGDGTFRPFAFVQVTWFPVSLLVADLNGDGHDDIATGTMSSESPGDSRSTISVLMGHGDGTFEPFVPYSIEPRFAYPSDLVGGDFDNDGDIDLVVVGAIGINPAQVFKNRGNGTFEPGRSLPPVMSRTARGTPAVGDLDGDGFDDLALCDRGPFPSGRLVTFHGDPTGLLMPFSSQDMETMPLIECKAADMDGDGDLDLVGVDAHGYAQLLTNNGDGNFTLPGERNMITGISPVNLIAAQLDADRIPDLAATEPYAVVVLRGAGDGTFKEAQRLEFTQELDPIAASRLDNDNIDDLAVIFHAEGQVAIFHGSADGTLVPGQVLGAGFAPHGIALAPLNGDTTVDIAVADFFSDTITLLLNDGEGRFTHGGTVTMGERSISLLAADLDRDGITDLVSGNADLNGTFGDRDDLSIVFGTGDGFFTPEIRLEVGDSPFSLAAGDLDGDGLWDLVASPGGRGRDISVWLGAPDRDFLAALPIPSIHDSKHVAVNDINSDGILDVFLGGRTGRLQILLGNGDGTFTPEFAYAVQSPTRAIISGDWNGDGRQDIAIASADSITLLENRGPFPAVPVPVEVVSRNPESRQHTRTRGVMVMEIQSTPEVDAAHILPETIRLGGAPVRQAGESGRYLCQTHPSGRESRPNLRCEVEAAAMTSGPEGSVLLEAILDDGTRIKGEAILNPE